MSKEARTIRTFLSTLVVISLAFFVLFQSKDMISGPQIQIASPVNGDVVDNSLTEITGMVENTSEIKLNGRNISIDEKGNFSEKVLLSYGYNTIVVEIKDRFNRKKIKKLELVLK